MDNGKIISRLSGISEKTIVVLGDFCLDKYVYSDPGEDDISVETGEAAWQIYKKKIKAGAAGTITNNLLSLGAKVICVGFCGNDGEGYDMKKCLTDGGADIRYIITVDGLATPTYFKTMRMTEKGYKEGVRLDFRNASISSADLSERLLNNFEAAIKEADGVVISDQFYERDTGIVTDSVREAINEIAARSNIPFLVDSRAFATKFRSLYVKCNNYELIKYCGVDGSPECYEDVASGSKRLSELTGCPVFITRNKDATVVYDGEVTQVPVYPTHGEIDVTGAGDASNAGLIIGLSLGLTPAESARLACAVSSITIHIVGDTGTATVEEVTKKLMEEI